MTEAEQAELRAAVARVNAAMAAIQAAHGGAVRVQPFVRFHDDAAVAEVHVEVTTGLLRFGPED